jgi:hypothetical protein
VGTAITLYYYYYYYYYHYSAVLWESVLQMCCPAQMTNQLSVACAAAAQQAELQTAETLRTPLQHTTSAVSARLAV